MSLTRHAGVIRATGCEMRHADTGCGIRDLRCGIRDNDSIYTIRNPESRFPYPESRISVPVSRIANAASRIPYLASRIAILIALWPATALAHTQGGEALGFFSGLAHPVSGVDHVLAMVAVGLWGAQLGSPAIWILPVTFPMVMAFGGTLGLMGLQLPGIEICIALSAIALGFMVLREAQPNLLAAAFLVGFFAIFHGHAHGTELPPGANGMLYSIGFVIATGTLHAAGIAIGLVHRWPVGRLALRAAGALVSLGGVVFLWRAIV